MDVNVIYHMDWLKNDLPDGAISLIIADPPYFETKGDFDFAWSSFGHYLRDVRRWRDECHRVLADNGTLIWWGSDERVAYSQVLLDKRFNLLSNAVWRKASCQTMRNKVDEARTFTPITERLLVYSKECDGMEIGELNYTYRLGVKHTEIMAPLVDYMIGEMERAGLTVKDINNATGTSMASHWFAKTSQWALPTREWYERLRDIFNGDYLRKEYDYLRKEYDDLRKEYDDLRKEYDAIRRPFNNINGRLEYDVMDYQQETHLTGKYAHETKKPETLTRMLVMRCSRPGDTVLAPFAGSGTECAMAAASGRNYIGYDINEKYVDMAKERCRAIQNQPELF